MTLSLTNFTPVYGTYASVSDAIQAKGLLYIRPS